MDFEITVSPRGESTVADDATQCINHSQSCIARATQCVDPTIHAQSCVGRATTCVDVVHAQSCINRATTCDTEINRATLSADAGDQLSPLDD